MQRRKGESIEDFRVRKYDAEKRRRDKDRDAFNAQRRDHYARNKEKRRKWFAEWYDKNREDQNEKQRVRNKRESYRAYRRELRRRKYATDVQFKLMCVLRSRVGGLLKGTSKSASTIKLLGCDAGFLRNYLEARFEPWMNWGNYGEWEIDHIIPCAEFDLTKPEQQRICFHYTNLRPLKAKENANWRKERPKSHQPEFL